jgi:hypothetical protein
MTDFFQLTISGMATGIDLRAGRTGLHAAVAGQRHDQLRPGRVRDAAGVHDARVRCRHGLPAADGLSWPPAAVAVVVLGWAFKRGIADPLLQATA